MWIIKFIGRTVFGMIFVPFALLAILIALVRITIGVLFLFAWETSETIYSNLLTKLNDAVKWLKK